MKTKPGSYGDIYGYAMKITDQAEADRFFGALVESMMSSDSTKGRAYCESVARSNIGYYAGYYNQETRERMEKLFNAVHPIMGPAIKKWSPHDMFAMGVGLSCVGPKYKGKSPEELIKIGQAEIDLRYSEGESGLTTTEVMVIICILAILVSILCATIIREMDKDKEKAAKQATNTVPVEDPPNHLIYKTNYLVISGLEEDPKTELPPGYAILSNEWGGFCFQDGNSMIHPFWADGAWKTEEDAVRAAWLSHDRRGKEKLGLLKPPNYLIVRTNETKYVQKTTEQNQQQNTQQK